MHQTEQKMNLHTKCPNCGTDFEQKDITTPPISYPISTWPFTQKMFPIQKRFGLATFGNGFVNSRSIYNHVIDLEPTVPVDDKSGDHFEKVSQFIIQYFKNQFLEECKGIGFDLNLLSDEHRPFGFQFAGFNKDKEGKTFPITHRMYIGKSPMVVPFTSLGCSPTGDDSVAKILWQDNKNIANYSAFSLQDAIDYAKFLIRSTADFQRFFSGKFRTVGGDIDIALITNHRGFQWIEQKTLYRMLDKEASI